MPTTFGNAVRGYEDYARVMYGFESITGWSRLQALFSRQASEVLSRSRARVDLWLNLCFVTILMIVELGTLVYGTAARSFLYLIPICFVFAWLAYTRARSSALRYGEQVKALVDIYLPQLCEKLGFTLSADAQKNRKFWQAYSRAMVYRDVRAITDMGLSGLGRSRSLRTNGEADASVDDNGD
jgi:hypothetical protein